MEQLILFPLDVLVPVCPDPPHTGPCLCETGFEEVADRLRGDTLRKLPTKEAGER